MRPDVAAWLARASADAEARGLAPLVPLLESLARSTEALRNADPEFTHAADAPPPNQPHAGDDTLDPS
jgi:hypothetical protein